MVRGSKTKQKKKKLKNDLFMASRPVVIKIGRKVLCHRVKKPAQVQCQQGVSPLLARGGGP